MKHNFDNGSLIPKASIVKNASNESEISTTFLDYNKSRILKIFFAIIGVITLVMFSIIAYKALKYSELPKSIDDVPLIKAELSPVKIVPKDPGGQQISNQDKLIYSTLENKNVRTKKISEQVEVKELKEVYSDAKTIRAPLNEAKPKQKVNTDKKETTTSKKVVAEKKDKLDVKVAPKEKTKVENKAVPSKEKKDEKNKKEVSSVKQKEDDVKIDVLALEKEVDARPTDVKQKESKANQSDDVSQQKKKISNPFDLVGEND